MLAFAADHQLPVPACSILRHLPSRAHLFIEPFTLTFALLEYFLNLSAYSSLRWQAQHYLRRNLDSMSLLLLFFEFPRLLSSNRIHLISCLSLHNPSPPCCQFARPPLQKLCRWCTCKYLRCSCCYFSTTRSLRGPFLSCEQTQSAACPWPI